MHLYKGISVARVGDGRHTLFWLDNWIGGEAIGIKWLVLVLHTLHHDATVGKRQSLVPRLTSAGER
jgi:hypothetical protein